jgi:WD40 repeat protein
MLWLVRCLEIAPAGDADLQQAIRANLVAWYGQLHPLHAQLPHGARIEALAFSPDEKRIATEGLDKTVRIWNTRTGQPLGAPLLHEEAVQAVAFPGDGKRLVVATVTPLIYTWDTTIRKLVGEPLKNAAWPTGMRRVLLSPDGSHMLVHGAGETAQLWEAESGKVVGALLHLQYAPDTATAFSPDDPPGGLQPGRPAHCDRQPRWHSANLGCGDPPQPRPAAGASRGSQGRCVQSRRSPHPDG